MTAFPSGCRSRSAAIETTSPCASPASSSRRGRGPASQRGTTGWTRGHQPEIAEPGRATRTRTRAKIAIDAPRTTRATRPVRLATVKGLGTPSPCEPTGFSVLEPRTASGTVVGATVAMVVATGAGAGAAGACTGAAWTGAEAGLGADTGLGAGLATGFGTAGLGAEGRGAGAALAPFGCS